MLADHAGAVPRIPPDDSGRASGPCLLACCQQPVFVPAPPVPLRARLARSAIASRAASRLAAPGGRGRTAASMPLCSPGLLPGKDGGGMCVPIDRAFCCGVLQRRAFKRQPTSPQQNDGYPTAPMQSAMWRIADCSASIAAAALRASCPRTGGGHPCPPQVLRLRPAGAVSPAVAGFAAPRRLSRGERAPPHRVRHPRPCWAVPLLETAPRFPPLRTPSARPP